MNAAAHFRRCYADDALLLGRVFELLETSFPGIAAHAARLALGGDWQDTSTPFVAEDAGQLVAHVGVLQLPVILNGEPHTLGGVHAVCTRPTHRGRGYCRMLMNHMIEWSQHHFQTLVLFTAEPKLYERFGFRILPEHRFEVDAHSPGGGAGFRPMDLHNREDLALLRGLLDQRQPVSDTFGITGQERGVFSFNCPDEGLWYASDLNAIVWMELDGAKLRIHDIIAPRIPRLCDILTRVPERVDGVQTLFTPDRLGVAATPVAHRHDGYLMVRGPFAVEGQSFMVPPTAHC